MYVVESGSLEVCETESRKVLSVLGKSQSMLSLLGITDYFTQHTPSPPSSPIITARALTDNTVVLRFPIHRLKEAIDDHPKALGLHACCRGMDGCIASVCVCVSDR